MAKRSSIFDSTPWNAWSRVPIRYFFRSSLVLPQVMRKQQTIHLRLHLGRHVFRFYYFFYLNLWPKPEPINSEEEPIRAKPEGNPINWGSNWENEEQDKKAATHHHHDWKLNSQNSQKFVSPEEERRGKKQRTINKKCGVWKDYKVIEDIKSWTRAKSEYCQCANSEGLGECIFN